MDSSQVLPSPASPSRRAQQSDYDFAFDPSLFPPPPPPSLPSSADLFSASETTDLYGFLDNFTFDFEGDALMDPQSARSPPPYPSQLLPAASEPSAARRSRPASAHSAVSLPSPAMAPSMARSASSASSHSPSLPPTPEDDSEAARAKTLLSTPQKRLNHIMSEQKRRNAVRDGYAQLISLIAPEGCEQAIAMPTRGRPKGSGTRNKGRTQGKSGVLFRAVEYISFLEEGRDALLEEVLKLERMAGILHEQKS